MAPLKLPELFQAIEAVTAILDKEKVEYAIMGGAAVLLLSEDDVRQTQDIDLVIKQDGQTNADSLSRRLLDQYKEYFVPIDRHGYPVPAYRLKIANKQVPVEVEIFDKGCWDRPQYDLARASQMQVLIPGTNLHVNIFSPAWLLREKIQTCYDRKLHPKHESDLNDVGLMISQCLEMFEGEDTEPELDFDAETGEKRRETLENALRYTIGQLPNYEQDLRTLITCRNVFDN